MNTELFFRRASVFKLSRSCREFVASSYSIKSEDTRLTTCGRRLP
jgi:hypothetical protein